MCPAFPAFPDERCTGYRHTGVALHTDGCPSELRAPNAVYDGCLFEHGITVFAEATNVTITRSKINGGARPLSYGDHALSMRNLKLVDVEIDGLGQWNNNATAIKGSDWSCERCYVHNGARGMHLNHNVRVVDSYITGPFVTREGDHKTAIGSNGGHGYELIHNNLLCSVDRPEVGGCSSAFSLYGDFAQVDDVLVQNNLFNVGPGTGSYCVYAGSVSSKRFPVATDVRFIDNRFGRAGHDLCGIYGPVTAWSSAGAGNVWRGNEWADGSGPVGP